MTDALHTAKFYFDLSNQSDFDGIAKLFTATTTYSSQTTGIYLGRDDILAMQRTFHGKFASLQWSVNSAEEVKPGMVRFDYDFLGELPNGEKIESSGLEYIIVYQGKIQHIEIRNNETLLKKGIDYIGVSAGAMVLNDQGKLFLAKRSQNCKNERGHWETPGGSVEFGETLEQAVKREMLEEYGAEIEILEQFPAADHLIPAESQHWVATTFLAKFKAGQTPKIMEPDKCDEIGWFTMDSLPQPLSLITLEDLKEYAKLAKRDWLLLESLMGDAGVGARGNGYTTDQDFVRAVTEVRQSRPVNGSTR